MIPLRFIQSTNPVVVLLGSNPCEEPRMVTPKSGGSNFLDGWSSFCESAKIF